MSSFKNRLFVKCQDIVCSSNLKETNTHCIINTTLSNKLGQCLYIWNILEEKVLTDDYLKNYSFFNIYDFCGGSGDLVSFLQEKLQQHKNRYGNVTINIINIDWKNQSVYRSFIKQSLTTYDKSHVITYSLQYNILKDVDIIKSNIYALYPPTIILCLHACGGLMDFVMANYIVPNYTRAFVGVLCCFGKLNSELTYPLSLNTRLTEYEYEACRKWADTNIENDIIYTTFKQCCLLDSIGFLKQVNSLFKEIEWLKMPIAITPKNNVILAY